MPFPVAAAIGAAGSIASSIGASQRQKKVNQQNYAWNAAEAQKQRDFQERMWNAANVYNSPLAQMNRFKEAGLNPNLIYGQMGSTNAGVPSGAKGSANAEVGQGPQIFSDAMQGFVKSAMAHNVQHAQIDNINQDTANKSVDNLLKLLKLDTDQVRNKYEKEVYQFNLQSAQENARKAMHEANRANTLSELEEKTLQTKIDIIAKDLEIKEAIETGKNLENTFLEFKARMAEQNININDPLYARQIQKYLETILDITGINTFNRLRGLGGE